MLFEKLGNCLKICASARVRGGKAGTFRLLRVLVPAAVFLFMGTTADLSAHATNADGDLRLVDVDTDTVVDLNSVTAPSGRLEIFDDPNGDGSGEWKGICDDKLDTVGWTNKKLVRGRQEAEVACRQLGFSGGEPITGLVLPASAKKTPSAYYLLDDLRCSGSEDRILGEDKCRYRPRGENDCDNNEAFGIACKALTSNNDAVGQIVVRGGGTEPKTGETMTADHSKVTDADGKPTADSAFSYQWIRFHLGWLWSEKEISGATASTYTLQKADEEKWIKVRISFTDNAGNAEELESFEFERPVYTNKPDGSLRLVTTARIAPNHKESGSNKGRLQIFDDQSKLWKGICDDNWDDKDAGVACRQLGYPAGGASDGGTEWFGYPRLLFLLDEVKCDGTEDTLLECDHMGRGVHDCTSWEYAGVICAAD